MSGELMAYIGREADCGCVTCVTIDNPDHKREVAKDVAQWVRWGMTVERVAADEARQMFTSCPHREQKAAAQTAEALF